MCIAPLFHFADTLWVAELIETLVEELERPREVTGQVAEHIGGTYEIERDTIGEFLDNKLPELEDYEHDLILSPLFTPKLADQALFAELLGTESLPKSAWPTLIEQLAARPTRGRLITNDEAHHSVVLRDVVLERYVHRLRLEGSIPDSVFKVLEHTVFAGERPLLKAIARRAIWEKRERGEILARYLSAASEQQVYEHGDGLELLRIAEDYKPSDIAHLMERIPLWQETLRNEIETSGNSKPFFSGTVQYQHGGARDQRQPDNTRLAAKKKEFAFLGRLQQVLIP
jgi:hypothetical protein